MVTIKHLHHNIETCYCTLYCYHPTKMNVWMSSDLQKASSCKLKKRRNKRETDLSPVQSWPLWWPPQHPAEQLLVWGGQVSGKAARALHLLKPAEALLLPWHAPWLTIALQLFASYLQRQARVQLLICNITTFESIAFVQRSHQTKVWSEKCPPNISLPDELQE